MAAHSSVLAWRTPSTEEPGRLQGGVIESQILLGKQQIFIYLYFGVLNILKADFTTFCMLIVIPALYVVLILCQALLENGWMGMNEWVDRWMEGRISRYMRVKM